MVRVPAAGFSYHGETDRRSPKLYNHLSLV